MLIELATLTAAAPRGVLATAEQFVPLAVVLGLFAVVAWICRPRPRPAPLPVVDLVEPLPYDDATYVVGVLERHGIRATARRTTAPEPGETAAESLIAPTTVVVRAIDCDRALAVLKAEPPRPPATPLDEELERALQDTSWFEPSERRIDAKVEHFTVESKRVAIAVWSIISTAMTAAAIYAAFG